MNGDSGIHLFTASFHCSVPRPTDSTIRASDAASAIAASTPTITLELLTISPLWKDLQKKRREERRGEERKEWSEEER